LRYVSRQLSRKKNKMDLKNKVIALAKEAEAQGKINEASILYSLAGAITMTSIEVQQLSDATREVSRRHITQIKGMMN
jgi:hypothetical protein